MVIYNSKKVCKISPNKKQIPKKPNGKINSGLLWMEEENVFYRYRFPLNDDYYYKKCRCRRNPGQKELSNKYRFAINVFLSSEIIIHKTDKQLKKNIWCNVMWIILSLIYKFSFFTKKKKTCKNVQNKKKKNSFQRNLSITFV